MCVRSLSACRPADKEGDASRVEKRWERGERGGVIRTHRITGLEILIRDNSQMTYLPFG